MKTNFSKVLWTDEMRVTLDGHRAAARVRCQQGDGGVMVWAAISNDDLVGLFWVADGLKMNSQNY